MDSDEDDLSVEVEENGQNGQDESEKNEIDACGDDACSAFLFVIDICRVVLSWKEIPIRQMMLDRE